LHVAAFLGRFSAMLRKFAGAGATAARGMCNNDVKQNMQLQI